jgi:hypothetical protein
MPPPTYIMRFVTHGGEVYSSCHLEAASNEAALEKANFFEAPSIGNGFKLWQGLWLVACITRVGGQRKIRRVAIAILLHPCQGEKLVKLECINPRAVTLHRSSDLRRNTGE